MDSVLFSISALEKAPVTLSGVLAPEFLDLPENDTFTMVDSVSYELTGQLVSGGVLVSGNCRTVLAADCGRCLKGFEFPLEVDGMQMFFEVADGQEELDVSEDLRAELLLELPMNPLCSYDCLGLCPVCGCDRNETDCRCESGGAAEKVSPWSALDGLKLD